MFEVPIVSHNGQIKRKAKIRCKYKFLLKKYNSNGDGESGSKNSSVFDNENQTQQSVITPLPSELDEEYINNNIRINSEGDLANEEDENSLESDVDYESKLLKGYIKPENTYEWWFDNGNNSKNDHEAKFQKKKKKKGGDNHVRPIDRQVVNSKRVKKLTKKVINSAEFAGGENTKHNTKNKELTILLNEILKRENSSADNITILNRNFLNKHVYNLITMWHMAIYGQDWNRCYKIFSILIRLPKIDIRSIWSLGVVTLKNAQQRIDSDFSAENNNNNNKKYIDFLEWLSTVFSSKTIFRQSTNYFLDPVWRSGSTKHTPIYIYSWLWSLLIETAASSTSSLTRKSYGIADDDSTAIDLDKIQWIIDKINEMCLVPPFMDDSMIWYILATAHLVKADHLSLQILISRTKNRNQEVSNNQVIQHLHSCKKALADVCDKDKEFVYDKLLIQNQLLECEKRMYSSTLQSNGNIIGVDGEEEKKHISSESDSITNNGNSPEYPSSFYASASEDEFETTRVNKRSYMRNNSAENNKSPGHEGYFEDDSYNRDNVYNDDDLNTQQTEDNLFLKDLDMIGSGEPIYFNDSDENSD
ncbi:uncharacterized protein SCODWIG_03848 [Saccharomycodes ludwigii]|uniref:RNA polymerase I-specific transcription initiation factor RRN11 n=1 Tax=Saccharomycodes ludwigii TaxID=36035 RepID=A0A376BBU1_9ASCO|nr:hypothetical protein SCDLUD_000910 [Saccharomycodes ludwigii]KAH3903285.1 hypothetical protein SCDLUD_000910 [Saccharomycodes ludwigii]SSD62086.1 uncharacterized protein SCODWIG_03848 [Saccharomycodes ludwigii]